MELAPEGVFADRQGNDVEMPVLRSAIYVDGLGRQHLFVDIDHAVNHMLRKKVGVDVLNS